MNEFQKRCIDYGSDNYIVVSHASFQQDEYDAANNFVRWENVSAYASVIAGTGSLVDGWLFAACKLAQESLKPVRFEIGVLMAAGIKLQEIVVHQDHAVVTDLSKIARCVRRAAVGDSLKKTLALIAEIDSMSFTVGPEVDE